MTAKQIKSICCVMIALMLGSFGWAGKKKKKAPVVVPLTEEGKTLEADYAAQLKALKAEIVKRAPVVDDGKKAAYLKLLAAEKAAEMDVYTKEKRLDGSKATSSWRLDRKKRGMESATKQVAEAEANLKQAEGATGTEEEKARAVTAAKENLTKSQANLENAAKGLAAAEAAAKKALAEEPALTRDLEAAENALAGARTAALNALKGLKVEAFVGSDKNDDQLTKCMVLMEATPRGLAEYAQQGEAEKALVADLLKDTPLMRQMLMADGARDGKYGQAMAIYRAIQKASPKVEQSAPGDLFQRLALGVSLEHAVPVGQRNPTGQTDAPTTVDPVKRYLHYEKASLAGELDEGFKGLSVWDYRFVTNGSEPDAAIAWGRKMLRNYRPDHISTTDYRWRYVKAVKTEIRYGSQDNKYDKPELHFYQNILMNGGVCGRRAFFGRFILRAFGVPTVARPQPGHAALAHWTPDGWVVCLGGGWGRGSTSTPYKKDLDFLASTQARENREAYVRVKRAHWVAEILGEDRVWGLYTAPPGFWNAVALHQQRMIIEEAKAVALAAVGTDIGEANESRVKEEIKAATITEEDRSIVAGEGGVITIPAVACSEPTNSTEKILFMKSNLGGMQLHYGRLSKDEPFTYTLEVPKAGTYKLTARVVTPSWKQHLFLTVNDSSETIDMALPFTVGLWGETDPVEITLEKGKNRLRFTRAHEGLKGVSIRDFTLTPQG